MKRILFATLMLVSGLLQPLQATPPYVDALQESDGSFLNTATLRPRGETYGGYKTYFYPGDSSGLIYQLNYPPGSRDTAPPLLTITSHSDLQLVSSAKIVLRGTATDATRGDNSVTSVKVNGYRATNDTASGSNLADWSRLVTLKTGVNRLKIVATDGSGNSTTNILRLNLDNVKPLIAITNPPSGQRTTSPVITIRGTASDNFVLSNIFVRLNDEVWQTLPPSRAWQLQKQLQPGMNTIVAYAEDLAGNRSAMVTNKVTLPSGAPLTVTVLGRGGVTPNYNGQTLILGDSYTITATNARNSGWKFLKWTDEAGRLLTNKPSLKFVMRQGLALTATFIDTNKPLVMISSPINRSVGDTQNIQVSGTATDNDSLSAVLLQVNTGPWILANSTANWSADATLALGTNILRAVSIDSSGNTSAVATVTCSYTTPDYQSIKAYLARMRQLAEAHDVNGFMAMYIDDYMHNGETKQQAAEEVAEVLPDIRTLYVDKLKVVVDEPFAQIAGDLVAIFPGPSTNVSRGVDLPGFLWVVRTSNGWRACGNAARAEVYAETGHNATPGDDHYFLRLVVRSPQSIVSARVSGPGLPELWLDQDNRWGGMTGFWDLEQALPAIGSQYHFTVRFADGTEQVLQSAIRSYVAHGPQVTVTPSRGKVIVRWNDLRPLVSNVQHYWVQLDANGLYLERDDIPPGLTSATFTDSRLQPGRTYTATVFVFNREDDFAYQMKTFQIP